MSRDHDRRKIWETLQDHMSPELMAELDEHHLYNTNVYNGKRPISREQDLNRREVRHDITTATTLNVIAAHLHNRTLEKRNKHPMRDIINNLHKKQRQCPERASGNGQDTASCEAAYTFGTFSSGGCLDAIACIQAGMQPIWGTEVC